MVGSDNNKQNVRFFIFVVADKQNCTMKSETNMITCCWWAKLWKSALWLFNCGIIPTIFFTRWLRIVYFTCKLVIALLDTSKHL